MPGRSSQARIRSVSSGLAHGVGGYHYGRPAEVGDVLRCVDAGGDDSGIGQAATADDVDRPPAVVLLASGDHLGAAGERGEPLGPRRGPDERRQPVPVHPGLLEALPGGQLGHPLVDRIHDVVGAVEQAVPELGDDGGVRCGVRRSVTGGEAPAHLAERSLSP